MYHKLPSFKEEIELPALFCMGHFVIKINNKTTHKHIHTSKHIKNSKKQILETVSKLQGVFVYSMSTQMSSQSACLHTSKLTKEISQFVHS